MKFKTGQLFLIIWLALLAVRALSCRAHGATYYVEPVAGDDGALGTIAAPWKTIGRATGTPYLNAGDTVYLRAGVYSGNTHSISLGSDGNPGTSNAPITIAAYPGETPVVCDIDTPYRPIMLYRTGGWTFDGITYSNNYQTLWSKSLTNCTFKNCTIGWMIVDGGYAGLQFFDEVATNSGARFNVVSNCTFRNWGEITAACNDNGAAISIGNADVDSTDSYNLIISNTFYGSAHSHIEVYSPYNVIRGNTFVNEPWLATNATCNTMSIGETETNNIYGAYGNRHIKPGDAGDVQLDQRNVFEHNVFVYTGPPPDDDGAFGIELATHQSIYRFNVIAFSLAAGIEFSSASSTAQVVSNAVYANTIYANGLANVYGGAGMQAYDYGIGMQDNYARSNNFIVNNIIWGNLPGPISPDVAVWQSLRNNFTNAASDPLFTSTNGYGWHYSATNLPDLHIATNSPCVDGGAWLAFTVGASNASATMLLDNSLYFSDGNLCVAGDTIQLQGQTSVATVTSNDWTHNLLYLSASLTWSNGQGVSLAYNGAAPDMGAYETAGTNAPAVAASGGGSAPPNYRLLMQ